MLASASGFSFSKTISGEGGEIGGEIDERLEGWWKGWRRKLRGRPSGDDADDEDEDMQDVDKDDEIFGPIVDWNRSFKVRSSVNSSSLKT